MGNHLRGTPLSPALAGERRMTAPLQSLAGHAGIIRYGRASDKGTNEPHIADVGHLDGHHAERASSSWERQLWGNLS